MTSDDLSMLQRDALAAMRQVRTQPAATTSLQAQAMQVAQLRSEAERSSALPSEQYLVFSLGEYELAVRAELVQVVERLGHLTPVPNVAAWVKGVVNLRGSIVSVVDLRLFLGVEELAYSARTRLLSLQYNEMIICLVVDGVSEMLPIPPGAIIDKHARQASIPQWIAPYAASRAVLGNRAMVLLDVAHLLFSEKMQHYQTLG